MPERLENGYAALVIGCAFCIACIAFTAITVAFSNGYQRADQEHSAYYAERDNAEIQYNKCLNSSPDLNRARECIDNSKTTNREAERAEQDLNAQREMAQWAEGMLWAAWVVGLSTVFATIIGVRYVYLTLVATQGMARETTRIGEAQVRAYPSVTSVNVGGITNGLPSIVIRVRNSGNSPAIGVKCRGRLMLTYQEDVPPKGTVAQRGMEISVSSVSQVPITPNSEGQIRVFVPHLDDIDRNSTMKEMASISPRKNPYWMVNIFFDWVDVFGNEYTFYINAEQHLNGIPVVGNEGVLTEMVLSRPFDISYQSESRDRSEVSGANHASHPDWSV